MQSPEAFIGRPIVDNIELLPSAARTETGTGDAKALEGFEVLLFQLDVTAAATAAGDLLDVFVQTTVDGTTWLDVIHFTQVLGNGGAKRYLSKVSASLALTEYETGAALAAAAVRNLIGSQWRVRWAITDATTDDASFTFSVKANGT
jgi:hypothetical protein